jgi:tetratricopeptide (TPR) repeat protein
MFLEAYMGLGEIWFTGGCVWGTYSEKEAWENALPLFQKALEIDSTSIHVIDMIHDGYFYYEWDFDLMENYYQSILREPLTNRRSASYHWASVDLDYLEKTGRYNEALENTNRRILFDPTVGVNYSFKAELLFFLGTNEEAIDLLETFDPLYDNDWWYLRETAKLYYYLEEYEKSRNHLNLLMNNFEDRPPILLWLNAVYYQMDGESMEAERYLEKLNNRYRDHASGSPAWFLALYYCTLDDYETAFIWLKKSCDRHEVEMTWLREEPLLIPVRDDPRYKNLYRKIGFPKRS